MKRSLHATMPYLSISRTLPRFLFLFCFSFFFIFHFCPFFSLLVLNDQQGRQCHSQIVQIVQQEGSSPRAKERQESSSSPSQINSIVRSVVNHATVEKGPR
ncbi:hypothetical protein BDV23DRAFT_150682 [Aspergillus alliaceus]|uniref:Uncharacterized protein n=1 Tax=Petromyces alliaceus TaxID=209559 RepID=A0A5N7CEL7_PETAA|nr:hypothetical protein BDV23DRAFT_150682 [Aspergillus alliaceus]